MSVRRLQEVLDFSKVTGFVHEKDDTQYWNALITRINKDFPEGGRSMLRSSRIDPGMFLVALVNKAHSLSDKFVQRVQQAVPRPEKSGMINHKDRFIKLTKSDWQKVYSLKDLKIESSCTLRVASLIEKARAKMGEGFSSDSDEWFDAIADFVQGGGKDPGLDAALKVAQHAPEKTAFADFTNAVKSIRNAPIKKMLANFVKDMAAGKYNSEFKHMFSKRVSQTAELFSFFKQAMLS